jgi:hypothetical protein
MRFFGTNHQDHRRETDAGSQSSARARLMSERGACSPRAAIAFSSLSAVIWLRENASRLVARSMVKWIPTGRENVAAGTHKTSPWTLREFNDR